MARKSPKKSKLGFSFEAQKFIYQIPNNASIVKSMATTKNSAKMCKMRTDRSWGSRLRKWNKMCQLRWWSPRIHKKLSQMENWKGNPQKKISKQHIFSWSHEVEGPATDPSKNSYANVTKPHQWTNSIKNPNIFTSEEEWLTHTIDSLLKRLDEIKNQKSNQNKAPCTSSASQSNEITLPVSAQITPEQRNESTISNSRSVYHRLLNLMHLQLQTMKMKWKALMQDQNEVIMTALTRNLIVLSAKSLPLVPQPVGGMALACRQGQEEEIYQRSPLSALTLTVSHTASWQSKTQSTNKAFEPK